MGLWNFNDVPKAYDDLMIVRAVKKESHHAQAGVADQQLIRGSHLSFFALQDIKNAKDYLASRGVHIE